MPQQISTLEGHIKPICRVLQAHITNSRIACSWVPILQGAKMMVGKKSSRSDILSPLPAGRACTHAPSTFYAFYTNCCPLRISGLHFMHG
ncbi:hypothetical protein ElyMa_006099000 [Elysia marginata]|uniref:Uncharacterized protein n=1 Tax=Elysia marginata TaxID=1093978 RepID=A0AAV4GST5_9GAST|nr:hypothetical protein ElyMa_006099000 [Elysia marginata]